MDYFYFDDTSVNAKNVFYIISAYLRVNYLHIILYGSMLEFIKILSVPILFVFNYYFPNVQNIIIFEFDLDMFYVYNLILYYYTSKNLHESVKH